MDAMVAAVLQKGAAGRPSACETREHLRNFKFRCDPDWYCALDPLG